MLITLNSIEMVWVGTRWGALCYAMLITLNSIEMGGNAVGSAMLCYANNPEQY